MTNITEQYGKVCDWFGDVIMKVTSWRWWPFRRASKEPPPSDDEDTSDSGKYVSNPSSAAIRTIVERYITCTHSICI